MTKALFTLMMAPDVKQPPEVDLELTLRPTEISDITNLCLHSSPTESVLGWPPHSILASFHGDEEGLQYSSSPWKTWDIFNPFHLLSVGIQDPLSSVATKKSSITYTSSTTRQQQKNQCTTGSSSKPCQIEGCSKGARGASGLCQCHGGGHRCKKLGCDKGAEGKAAFCKAHGGGLRCQVLGCIKSAGGPTEKCTSHGGGRVCTYEGCKTAARCKSGLCIKHGGGPRCQKENCKTGAADQSGLCIAHGGGPRCEKKDCMKGAQRGTKFCKAHGGGNRCTQPKCKNSAEGSTSLCKRHGGGKRCMYQDGRGICPKNARGRNPPFCVEHGGGKKCAIPECTTGARGRYDFCVRHGGGRRCEFRGCGSSAQGSTDFCKAHGGGKRCSWGRSEFGQGEVPCNLYAGGEIGLCREHDAWIHSCPLVYDKRVRGGTTHGPMVQDPSPSHGITIVEEVTQMDEDSTNFDWERFRLPRDHFPVLEPQEGRVHGPQGSISAFSMLKAMRK